MAVSTDWEDLEQIEIRALWRIWLRLGEILTVETEIRDLLISRFAPVKFIITQGVSMPVTGKITGLVPGTSDTFFATPVDNLGNADVLPSGTPPPTVTADDPAVGVTVAPDGLSAMVAAPANATPGGSFNLTWSTTLPGAATAITGTANVPFLKPPQGAPVGFVIGQGTAPA
jgi:hypothetical protein